MIKNKRIYLDSDGVFAHFDAMVFTLCGAYPKDLDDDAMWEEIKANADHFWVNVPVKDDAHMLWEYVKPYNPTVITGCPKGHFDVAAAHKKAWWEKHFAWSNIICCPAKLKSTFMENAGDILIDDFSANIKRWVKAGGIGIHHTDAESTIAQLKTILIEE